MKNKIKYRKVEIEENIENIVAIDKTRLVEIVDFQLHLTETGNASIERRVGGPFERKAIYLSKKYDWTLGEDVDGVICLVPLKKIEE